MSEPSGMDDPISEGTWERVLPLFVCPACRESLGRRELTLRGGGRSYPIREGIAVLVAGESTPAEPGQEERRT